MLVLCLPFFHVFMFGSILVCLDLISCILATLPMSCFPFGFMLVGVWGFLVSLLYLFPFYGLFGYNHVWGYIFVMFGLLATCLFPPLLVCMLEFLVLASLCALEHAYPFPLCDKMLAMLALCHLVRLSVLLCIFISLLICSWMSLCMLVRVIKPSSYI